MFVYNTTYTMTIADARAFLAWAHEVLLPAARTSGLLNGGHILRVLSHHDSESKCYAIQFEAESMTDLHRWHIGAGRQMEAEMAKVFGGRIAGFGTLMERVEE